MPRPSFALVVIFGFGESHIGRKAFLFKTSDTLQPLVHALYGMKRKAFLPMWDSPKPKMTTSATLGLGKNCPHTNDMEY